MLQYNHSTIHIRSAGGANCTGILRFAHLNIQCMLGRNGIRARKTEGDGATPAGNYRILYGFYRQDRIKLPVSKINLFPIKPNYCWCDDPSSPSYNRFVTQPIQQRHEKLWREDNLYDICLVLDHNHFPRKRNAGSAIFFHIKHPDNLPTEGCVATTLSQMNKILLRCDTDANLIIHA